MSSLFSFVILTLCLNFNVGEELIELGCYDDRQCKQFEGSNTNASCIEGQCQCRSNAIINTTEPTELRKCIPQDMKISNIIGGHCPCRMPQAVCKEEQNVCYCAQGYVASADKRRCLKENVSLGETCETDKQCHFADFYAVCDAAEKICTCQTNFTANKGICVSIADAVTKCHNNSDCSAFGSNVICLQESQTCICNEQYVKAKNKTECLPLVAYQGNCTEDQQCLKKLGPGGACISGSCECRDMHYVVQKQPTIDGEIQTPKVLCTRIIEIGEYCYEDKDCYQRQLPDKEQTMSCIYGECNCKYGYYSINNLECVKGSRASSTSLHVSSTALAAVSVIAFGL